MRRFSVVGVFAFCFVLAGCAVPQQATTFSPAATAAAEGSAPQTARLQRQVDVSFAGGYTRTLKADSLWQDVGKVDQGEVYKPWHDVFTIEGSHIHEAYLVVADSRLTGFYLPYEKKFSPLSSALPISFIRQEQ